MKYGNRSVWKKIASSHIAIVALVVLVVILAKASWGISQKVAISKEKLDLAIKEQTRLEDYKSELSRKIGYLSTDQGIEAELRTKYRAIHEGESIAVIIDNDQSAAVATAASSSTDSVEKSSWWDRVLKAVGL